jgi:DHA3 family macrolide efflux protein-like MFS transporter
MSDEMIDANPTPAEESASGEAIPIPSPVPDPLSLREVLAIAPLRRLWYAQTISVFGDFMALFAVITVMTFQLHGTPQQITGVQIAYLLPIAILGVISGVFVDRWPVKITLVASDFTRALLCLFLLRVHSVYGYYAVMASISVFSSFFSPAQGVAIRSVVPMHGLRAANSLMQQAFFILRIIGGPVAIFVVHAFTAKVNYWMDSASFLASGTLILSIAIHVPRKSAVVAAPEPADGSSAVVVKEKAGVARILEDMKEGMSFIFHHAALLFVILALAAAMFVMGCFGPLIAVFVRDSLHASSGIFSACSATIGVGLFLGMMALTSAAKRVKNTSLVYFGMGGIAAGALLMALGPHITFARIPVDIAFTLIGCFTIGFACAGIIIPSQTMIQQETPQAMLGRVGSTVMSLIFSAQIAGLLLSGVLANDTSIRRVFMLCTIMMAVLMLAGKLWMEPEEHTPAPTT